MNGPAAAGVRVVAGGYYDSIGTRALAWLTEHVFTTAAGASRIEGTTRQDNVAMRRLFRGGTTSQPEKTGRLPTATAAGPAVPAGRPCWPKVLVIGDGMVRGRLWIVAGWAASRRTLSSRVIAAR